jgi:hypothetical protein
VAMSNETGVIFLLLHRIHRQSDSISSRTIVTIDKEGWLFDDFHSVVRMILVEFKW